MTTVISGRPARCIANKFTAMGEEAGGGRVPAYPIAYDAAKALNEAAKAAGETGFGAHSGWPGRTAGSTHARCNADRRNSVRDGASALGSRRCDRGGRTGHGVIDWRRRLRRSRGGCEIAAAAGAAMTRRSQPLDVE